MREFRVELPIPLTAKPMTTQHDSDLAEQIKQLEMDRERHADAMAEIDRVLERIHDALGQLNAAHAHDTQIHLEQLTQPLRPVLEFPQTLPHRRRGRFQQTAVNSVLDFIRNHANPSTAEINAHWRTEGRKGTVNVTLLKLLQQGLIRRVKDDSVRGSRYEIVEKSDENVEV